MGYSPRLILAARRTIIKIGRISSRFRGNGEHLGIGYADNTAFMSAEYIDGWFPPAETNYDFVVEIGVRLESRPHALGV